METAGIATAREPWNKGKIVGQKAPFKLKDIWALRVRLQMESPLRELALFNLGIDSKLRGCDLVALKVRYVCHGDQLATRAIVIQHKTQRSVQFEITQATRDALQAWIKQAGLEPEDFLFPSRLHGSPHLGTRQYARILGQWVDELGLDPADCGTHSMRRTKATLIHRRTKNLRAVQLLLGHFKLESTVRYLGIEVDDALEISERRDGITHLVMSPLEFMQRLAALVPRPRLHLIRFHGVLAPNAKLRALVVPQLQGPEVPQQATEAAAAAGCEAETVQAQPHRISWAPMNIGFRRTIAEV